MKKFHQLKNQKGLTLPELMIVLAITAVLAGISIPMFISYVPTMRLNGAAQNLQLALALARMKAVARNTSSSILLSGGTYKMQIWNKTTGLWEDETQADKLMSPTDLPSQGITITFANTFPNGGIRIIFNNRGNCVDSATTSNLRSGGIELRNRDNKKRCLNVNGSSGVVSSAICP